jgi:enterochelin esterase-like enzyme
MKPWYPALVAAAASFLAPPAHADLLTAVRERLVMEQTLRGHLSRVSWRSPALGESRTVYVYTPPGYRPNPPTPYPVVVLLHGAPGAPIDWLDRGGTHRMIDDAIHSGALPPCLVAIPDGHGPFYKGGSEWADSIDGRCQMETAITTDLTRFLTDHYSVSRDPSRWVIAGVSEGGYGAANLAVRHPDVFGNALVLSGDLRVTDDFGDADAVFGTDPARRSANSPIEALHGIPIAQRRRLHFYIAVGADDDAELVAQAEGFRAIARSLGIAARIDRDPGRHQWGFWSDHLKTGLIALLPTAPTP